MNFHELMFSPAGLGTMLLSLILGIIALLPVILRLIAKKPEESQAASLAMILGIILILISASIFTYRAYYAGLNIKLTASAWEAFEGGQYNSAIRIADDCIKGFQKKADRQQAELESKNVPIPATGMVSEAEKEVLADWGLLNDVATCFYIKGQAWEKLGLKEDAIQAYQAVLKYTYARCWNPAGWFWSPAEAAAERISILK